MNEHHTPDKLTQQARWLLDEATSCWARAEHAEDNDHPGAATLWAQRAAAYQTAAVELTHQAGHAVLLADCYPQEFGEHVKLVARHAGTLTG